MVVIDINRAKMPATVLHNPSQLCYLNSVAVSLAWSGILTGDMTAIGGRLSACLTLVVSARSSTIPNMIPWVSVVRDWPRLHA